MAGLVPAIHAAQYQPMRGGRIYIVTTRPNGVLYTGVTSNLSRRIYEHREGRINQAERDEFDNDAQIRAIWRDT